MKKVLILGAGGMLGHKLYHKSRNRYYTYGTLRSKIKSNENAIRDQKSSLYYGIDAFNMNSIKEIIQKIQPDIVINCIGIISQKNDAQDIKKLIYVNSLFPHLLSDLCMNANSKLIHISTDCVFSGKIGQYSEVSESDANDFYGRTKYLGEVINSNTITIRTSIIGHENGSRYSLIDWFLSNKGSSVEGYKHAIYSGLPTISLSREIIKIIDFYSDISGLFQIASEPISKYDLLVLVNTVYSANIKIIANNIYQSDKSLQYKKYSKLTNYKTQPWGDLVKEMYHDYVQSQYRKSTNA